jgi:hypothetical protein
MYYFRTMIAGRSVSEEFDICLDCGGMVWDGLCDAMRCGSMSGLVFSKIVFRNHLAQSDQWHCGSFTVLLERCW